MPILALRASVLTLFVAFSTLVLADVEVVPTLVAPVPLLLVAVGATTAARRLATAWSGPRPAAAPVNRRPGQPGRGSF